MGDGVTRAEQIEAAARAARAFLDGTRDAKTWTVESPSRMLHRRLLVALLRAVELPADEPALCRAQAMRIAEAVRRRAEDGVRAADVVSLTDSDLAAIVTRVLGEPSEVERAERAALAAGERLFDVWPESLLSDPFIEAYRALRAARERAGR